MKKSNKLIVIGTLGAIAIPIAAFSLVSQGFIEEKEGVVDDAKHDETDINTTNYGIGVDPSAGDDHSSVQVELKEKNNKLTITLTGEGTIDKELFNRVLKSRFYKSNGSDDIVWEDEENFEVKHYPVEKIIITKGVKLPDDSSDLFNFRGQINANGQHEFREDNTLKTLNEYKNQDNTKVIFEDKDINTSEVTNMQGMFKNTDLDGIDFSKYPNWDVSKVTDFSKMFESTENANLDLSNWDNDNINNLDQAKDMFKYTNGTVTLKGSLVKKLFEKYENKADLMKMGSKSDTSTEYGIYNKDGKILAYLSDNNKTPGSDQIADLNLKDDENYTFKPTNNVISEINNFENLNQMQKLQLKIDILGKYGDLAFSNQKIKKANELDQSMAQLKEANDKLQVFVKESTKDKYTDESNKLITDLNKKVQDAIHTENIDNDGVLALIKKINELKPEIKKSVEPIINPSDPEASNLDSNKDIATNKIDNLKNLTDDQKNTLKEQINESSKNSQVQNILENAKELNKTIFNVKEQLLKLIENKAKPNFKDYDKKLNDILSKVENKVPVYKETTGIYIDSLAYLNKAQKDTLKEQLNSKKSITEISNLIDEANNLDSKMLELTKVSDAKLIDFIEEKDALSDDLKNTVDSLTNEIKNVLNVKNDKEEVNKNQKGVQELIDKVNNLLINYKNDALSKIKGLKNLNKAQKNALKEDINKQTKPSQINKIVDNSVILDSKMQELIDANENTLVGFTNKQQSLSDDLKNIVSVLDKKVRNVINLNNEASEANKGKESVQQLTDQINALLALYKKIQTNNLNSPKYKYLNNEQKEDLKNKIDNAKTKKELDAISEQTKRLDNKMKQLSVATVTDLQEIIDAKKDKSLTLEATDLKNEIIPYLPTNESADRKYISEQEVDKYLKDIENLKARYTTLGTGNIKDINVVKRYYSGLITANVIATVVALIATVVIIKRYKNRNH